MAVKSGKDGYISVGANEIGQVMSYSYEVALNPVGGPVVGSSSPVFSPGVKAITGSVEVYFDDADAGQAALLVDTALSTLTLRPEGTGSGNVEITFDAVLSNRSYSVAADGAVTVTASFQSSGAITEGTQP